MIPAHMLYVTLEGCGFSLSYPPHKDHLNTFLKGHIIPCHQSFLIVISALFFKNGLLIVGFLTLKSGVFLNPSPRSKMFLQIRLTLGG